MKNNISLRWKISAYGFFIFFSFVTLAPLVWMVYSSFKLQGEIMLHPMAWPKNPTIKNYKDAMSLGHMNQAAINSIIYTSLSTGITAFLAVSCGFALTKFGFRKSAIFSSLFALGLLITVNSIITPLFIMETSIGLYNTRIGVILPYIAFGMPMSVLIASSFVEGIPNALIEAAVIDGADYLTIFSRIIMQISAPVIATILVLMFLRNWNEFILVFILTSGEKMRSLPVSINSFAGRLNVNYGMQFAALVIGTIPMILFYLFAHNLLIKGFGEGALKE